jgi:hypothetical protein
MIRMETNKYYQQAILSEASYAELQNKIDPQYIIKALTEKGHSLSSK